MEWGKLYFDLKDDYWSGVLIIPAYIYDSFSFKYVVSSFEEPCSEESEWEHGSNRKVTIENDKRCMICSKKWYHLDHKWNKEKVTLYFCSEKAELNE